MAAAVGALAAKGAQEMIELPSAIAALASYWVRLKAQGKILKVAAVEHCVVIIRRL